MVEYKIDTKIEYIVPNVFQFMVYFGKKTYVKINKKNLLTEGEAPHGTFNTIS